MYIPIIVYFNKKIIVKSIFAIIIPALIMSLSYLIIKVFGIDIVFNNIGENWLLIYPMLLAQLLGAIGEEIGWRSFYKQHWKKRCLYYCHQ
jgi:membrane protease YdiL (CAAX protease family)